MLCVFLLWKIPLFGTKYFPLFRFNYKTCFNYISSNRRTCSKLKQPSYLEQNKGTLTFLIRGFTWIGSIMIIPGVSYLVHANCYEVVKSNPEFLFMCSLLITNKLISHKRNSFTWLFLLQVKPLIGTKYIFSYRLN